MRKVVVGAFTSLDGVMQAPGGPEEDPVGGFTFGGWFAPHFDEKLGEAVGEMFAYPFDLLLGRKTYDIFAAHWPYAPADDPIGALFDRVRKYVATRNPGLTLDWQNSHSIGPDAIEAVKKLKQDDGPDLLTQGSTVFLKALLAHDLVDEINLFVAPVVLGKGKKLFDDDAHPGTLKLVNSGVSTRGVIISRYVRDGDVATGSFAQAEPSDAEKERRRDLT